MLGGLVFVSVRALTRSSVSRLGDLLVAGMAVYIANLLVATVDYSFFVWTGLLFLLGAAEGASELVAAARGSATSSRRTAASGRNHC